MKRIVIALAAAAVLAGGVVVAWNVFDNSSVATASGPDRTVPRAEVEKQAKENYAIPAPAGCARRWTTPWSAPPSSRARPR